MRAGRTQKRVRGGPAMTKEKTREEYNEIMKVRGRICTDKEIKQEKNKMK